MIKRIVFLSDFTESKIELVDKHILVIDGKRYINRGPWLIDGIDVKQRLVYKDNLDGNSWFTETVRFDQVDLIPLFGEKK